MSLVLTLHSTPGCPLGPPLMSVKGGEGQEDVDGEGTGDHLLARDWRVG